MNKKLLSLAVAAGLASSSANAAVDLNAAVPAPVQIATENTIAPTGTAILNAGSALDLVVNAGFSISDSTARYMRFDFTGTTFTAAVTSGNLAVDDTSGAGGANEVLSTGGALGGTSVVFEVTASAGQTVQVANDATLALGNYTVAAEGTIGVTYRLYDNAVDAVNNTTASALVTTSGSLASFTAGNATVANNAASANIDVTQGATFFTGGTGTVETTIGGFTTTDTAGTQVAVDGATDVNTAASEATSTLTVTGDFTFAQDLTSGAPDGTYTLANVNLDTVSTCANAGTAATSITDTTAVINSSGVGAGTAYLCITANGVSTISESAYTGVYLTTANAGFDVETSNLTFNTLQKNGSTVTLNLALKPGGAFSNFVRVNNTSNITGDVSMRVINDDGDSVTIQLGDIAGVSSSSLAGQASTDLIGIQAIFDAAQAADSTFALGANSNKLRIVIDGEFSTIAAQSVTLSTDNTTFTTF